MLLKMKILEVGPIKENVVRGVGFFVVVGLFLLSLLTFLYPSLLSISFTVFSPTKTCSKDLSVHMTKPSDR